MTILDMILESKSESGHLSLASSMSEALALPAPKDDFELERPITGKVIELN